MRFDAANSISAIGWNAFSPQKMKLAVPAFIAAVLLGWVYLHSPFSTDYGLRFGYFGELNDILGAVEKEEELEVLNVTQHRDISLEDFSIYLRTVSGRECVIDIVDYASVRDSSDQAKGVMIFGKDYRKVRVFKFSDKAFWDKTGYPASDNIRGLLPVLDRFLEGVDASAEPSVDLNWEESYDYIRIRYTSHGAPVAFRAIPENSALSYPWMEAGPIDSWDLPQRFRIVPSG